MSLLFKGTSYESASQFIVVTDALRCRKFGCHGGVYYLTPDMSLMCSITFASLLTFVHTSHTLNAIDSMHTDSLHEAPVFYAAEHMI